MYTADDDLPQDNMPQPPVPEDRPTGQHLPEGLYQLRTGERLARKAVTPAVSAAGS
jgi:hypothetical protein